MKKLVLVLALVAATSVASRSSAGPQDPATTPMGATANSALVDDITRLWKANLSEEFINKYFARTDLARDLTPDDVVRLREAGVPETAFMANLDVLSENAFDDQCTGANPRYPLISEIKEIYLAAYKA